MKKKMHIAIVMTLKLWSKSCLLDTRKYRVKKKSTIICSLPSNDAVKL